MTILLTILVALPILWALAGYVLTAVHGLMIDEGPLD